MRQLISFLLYFSLDQFNHNDCHVDHSHQDSSKKVANGRTIALRDFFTVLALSFHAVFEGLAIGLEPDSADIWILFAGNMSISFFQGRPQ